MFERFTKRARQAVVYAQEEAAQLRHGYIGTEHMLLGLIREEDGLASRVLDSLGITLDGVREQIVGIVGRGEAPAGGQMPFTPRAKKALELALREAISLGHDYIGTEHVLLGVMAVKEGVGARILADAGVDADRLRAEISRALSGPSGGGTTLRTRHSTLLLACPACGTAIERATTGEDGPPYEVAADAQRTCSQCGKRWRIDYRAAWEELG